MGKINTSVHRKDSYKDHAHEMPNGRLTGGELMKPSKDRFGWHTHLYEHEGRVCESGPAHEGADHAHETIWGDTGGPVTLPKDTAEPMPRVDSLRREGSMWTIRNGNGALMATGLTKMDAMDIYKDVYTDEDEHWIKATMKDVDEALWEKAKRASQEAFGKLRWPFINWWYSNQGGT